MLVKVCQHHNIIRLLSNTGNNRCLHILKLIVCYSTVILHFFYTLHIFWYVWYVDIGSCSILAAMPPPTGRATPLALLLCFFPHFDYGSFPLPYSTSFNILYRLTFSDIKRFSKSWLDGLEVVPLALFEALDGTRTEDYVERVEPSSGGGWKIAKFDLTLS